MEYSLSAAAKAAGKGKSTIHHAIKTGKLSARREEDGSYKIDASELARVFTLNLSGTVQRNDPEPPSEPLGSTEVAVLRVTAQMLEAQIARYEEQIARDRDTYRETVDDLRKRLDRAEERVQALTFQGQAQAKKPVGFLGRLLGRL